MVFCSQKCFPSLESVSLNSILRSLSNDSGSEIGAMNRNNGFALKFAVPCKTTT